MFLGCDMLSKSIVSGLFIWNFVSHCCSRLHLYVRSGTIFQVIVFLLKVKVDAHHRLSATFLVRFSE
uniref:Uncharacterized protein n=1 Tax=Anguilla anguilla TaxID=7936 RepID=A0A0E9WSW0_ANGAN